MFRWPRRILHFGMGHKRQENSLRGVAYAEHHGFDGVDFDLHVTADGVVVGLHDEDPYRFDKFSDPRGIIPNGTPIHALTWDQAQHLVSPDGYRIRRIETLLRACAQAHETAVLEPKTLRAGSPAVWAHVVAYAAAVGCQVAAYALRSHHGVETMRNARRAGVRFTRIINR